MRPDDSQADAEALLRGAMDCHRQGNLYDADRLYAQGLALRPDDAQALRLRGILARECGDTDQSLQLLGKATDVNPRSADAVGELALTWLACGDFQQAEQCLRRSLDIDAGYVKGLVNLGALLQHRGHLAEATELYRRALERDPADLPVRCNLAKTLSDSGAAAAATAECVRAIEMSDRHPHALAVWGAVLTDQENYAEARTILEEATRANPQDDMALVNLALACCALGDNNAAIAHLSTAIAANPYNARAVADRANCLTAAGQHDEAIELCVRFLGAHPGERLIVGAHALALLHAGRDAEAYLLTNADMLVQRHRLALPEDCGDIETLNRALATTIANDPSLLDNPVSKSTYGGAQTGELDAGSAADIDALLAGIAAAVEAAIGRYRETFAADHPVLAPASEQWMLRSWGTVLREGGRQTPHMHPLAWLSGVYYVQVPDDMATAGKDAGWLEFGRPPERFCHGHEPQTYRFEPRAGELIIFPSWFWHQTLPFRSGEQRISIAFDVMPQSRLQML